MRKILFQILFVSIFIQPCLSQDSIRFSGYLDTYYSYDFSEPANNQRQYVTQAARHNEFNINLAMITAEYASKNIRSTIALQTGTYPVINYAEPSPLAQIINEANVGVRLGETSWVDVGVMSGHFGYESAFSFNNELYTQALVTEYTPYYQTGIQYTNQLSEDFALRAVIVNGWQNIYETNNAKALGTALDYSINESIFLSYGNYFGNEPTVTGDELRMHHNVYGTYTNEEFSVAALLDLTFQNPDNLLTDPTVFITVITSYKLTDTFSINARFESIRDFNGILIANDFQTNILTGALSYTVHPRAILKAEGRIFFGSEPIWTTETGLQDNNQVISTGLAIKI